MLKWIDNVAIGKDGDTYVIFEVKENGDLWISGDNWRGRRGKDGLKPYPNTIAKLGSIEKAIATAEAVHELINSKEYLSGISRSEKRT